MERERDALPRKKNILRNNLTVGVVAAGVAMGTILFESPKAEAQIVKSNKSKKIIFLPPTKTFDQMMLQIEEHSAGGPAVQKSIEPEILKPKERQPSPPIKPEEQNPLKAPEAPQNPSNKPVVPERSKPKEVKPIPPVKLAEPEPSKLKEVPPLVANLRKKPIEGASVTRTLVSLPKSERSLVGKSLQDFSQEKKEVTEEDIVNQIKKTFGPVWRTAAAIARAESLFVVDDVNKSPLEISVGVFQINLRSAKEKVHYDQVPGDTLAEKKEWLSDYRNNIDFARKLYDEFGFIPWTTFTKRKYLAHLPYIR